MVDECIYGQSEAPQGLKDEFASLKKDTTPIEGMDFGQGRRTSKTVGHYAKSSSIADYQVDLLFRLSQFTKAQSILELGSNLGKTTLCLRSAKIESTIVTVEGNEALHEFTKLRFEQENIESHCQRFEDFLKHDDRKYDLVFVDGDHNYDPTLQYFSALKSKLNPNGLIVFHDIYWSDGMRRAWQAIKQDSDVQVTVDLFFMGLVWLDLPQEKQHFSIKFPENVSQLIVS